jgi:hypothetical protein
VPDVPNSIFANGNYQATIFADAIIGPDGLPMQSDADLPFFFLMYDIWSTGGAPDRLVGIQDYNKLAGNFGLSPAVYKDGD